MHMRLQVKIELKGYYTYNKINSKAFAIPTYSDCYLINHYKPDAVRIEIVNASELIFVVCIITLELDFNLQSHIHNEFTCSSCLGTFYNQSDCGELCIRTFRSLFFFEISNFLNFIRVRLVGITYVGIILGILIE